MGLTERKKMETTYEGVPVTVSIGCSECPESGEKRVSSLEELAEALKLLGQTITCPICGGKWTAELFQAKGMAMLEAKRCSEEWRFVVTYTPIIHTFNLATMQVLDVHAQELTDSEDQ